MRVGKVIAGGKDEQPRLNMVKSKCKTVYEFHPLASHYELLDGKEAEELKASIAAIGCRVPAVIYEDMILDGRNRWIICQELGVECPTTIYEGDEPELFVEAMNGHRRHLTTESKLVAAVALAKDRTKRLEKAGTKCQLSTAANQHGAAGLTLAEQQRIAGEHNVSERTVRNVSKILDEGSSKVVDALVEGEVKITDAAAIADLPKGEQAAAVKAVSSGDAKTLTEAAILAKLDPAVVTAFRANEFTLKVAKKLSAMDRFDQLGELKKIRAAAERKAKANAPSTQVVAGRKTEPTPKPPANDSNKGPAKDAHALIGKLSRKIDDLAREHGWPKQGVKAVHDAINEVKQRVFKLERGK